jgi:hypothetical protein
MITKSFEIRDRATFIPAVAIKMVPANEEQRYLLRRCGYGFDHPAVLLTRMDGNARAAPSDPYDWGDRTMTVAHDYITQNFDSLADGSVIDVEHILGKRPEPKASERLEGVSYDR